MARWLDASVATNNPMDYRIISIGALSRHPLWRGDQPQRTAHATTTLVRSGGRVIVVDPSLPAQVLDARLGERAGLKIGDVTDVFLTNFRPAHRRGLAAFENAKWWVSEAEREAIGVSMIGQLNACEDEALSTMLKGEIALLQKCRPAPDRLAESVDLFPLYGYTPGSAGLLLTLDAATVLIAGDAVATQEHLGAGQVLGGCFDVEQAQASFAEAVEIADWIVCGHDNLLPNETGRPF